MNERVIDVTGAELAPGDPEHCQGNGHHPGFECCCDECDYLQLCVPNSAYERGLTLEEIEEEIVQAWVRKNDGDLTKAYQALYQDLEQDGKRYGAGYLVDERGLEMGALIRMEEMLGIKENER